MLIRKSAALWFENTRGGNHFFSVNAGPACRYGVAASILECGGKRSATPLWI
jgi:hypothetical protein